MDRRIFLKSAGSSLLAPMLPSQAAVPTGNPVGLQESNTSDTSITSPILKDFPIDCTVCRVISVGGAGGRMVSEMHSRLFDADRIIAIDTDAYALGQTTATDKILLIHDNEFFSDSNRSDPNIATDLAWKARKQIENAINRAHIVFIATGMGGATGSGATPVIAKIAKEFLGEDSLVIVVAATPFNTEGERTKRIAEQGMHELRQSADSVIEIPNGRLFDSLWQVNGKTWQKNGNAISAEYFTYSHRVFGEAYAALVGPLIRTDFMNLDLEDIRTVLTRLTVAPVASVGWGEATGKNAGRMAAQKASDEHPLLGAERMAKVSSMHVAISAGKVNLNDVKGALYLLRDKVMDGATISLSMDEQDAPPAGVRVTIVAIGEEG